MYKAEFNVVTHVEGIPHAVLIRSIQPTEGIETMIERRHKQKLDATLTRGPGALTQALQITRSMNGIPLTDSPLWIEDREIEIPESAILITPRIGIDYAGVDAELPWRFLAIDHLL
jgi:DNA-3-methyladenine glycosylase